MWCPGVASASARPGPCGGCVLRPLRLLTCDTAACGPAIGRGMCTIVSVGANGGGEWCEGFMSISNHARVPSGGRFPQPGACPLLHLAYPVPAASAPQTMMHDRSNFPAEGSAAVHPGGHWRRQTRAHLCTCPLRMPGSGALRPQMHPMPTCLHRRHRACTVQDSKEAQIHWASEGTAAQGGKISTSESTRGRFTQVGLKNRKQCGPQSRANLPYCRLGKGTFIPCTVHATKGT